MPEQSPDQIISRAKSIISRISRIDVAELENDVLLRDELGIDSLIGMEIVAACERHLAIVIDEVALSRIERVGEFFDLLVTAAREPADSRG